MFEQSSHHGQLDVIAHVSLCLFWASVIPQRDLKESRDATPDLLIYLAIARCPIVGSGNETGSVEGSEVDVNSGKEVIIKRVKNFLLCLP
ncbi:hypothetical protein Trydic_g2053 [Trypoxylus dichotomus]